MKFVHLDTHHTVDALALTKRIQRMMSYEGWDKVFAIDKPAYRELTLEVLSTFEVDKNHNT